jgi:ankyrin repeat protein
MQTILPETIKALLTGRADIEAPNAQGETPLMSALSPPLYTGINDDKQLKNIECLLSSGANANARDKEGRTPLSLASDCDTFGKRDSSEEQKKLSQSLIALLKKHGAKRSK